jgi:hypothetical protein
MIGRAKTSARQRCSFSGGFSRAGFEPCRAGGCSRDCARIPILGSRQPATNAGSTERLKSGAELMLLHGRALGAPRFSPYQRLALRIRSFKKPTPSSRPLT